MVFVLGSKLATDCRNTNSRNNGDTEGLVARRAHPGEIYWLLNETHAKHKKPKQASLSHVGERHEEDYHTGATALRNPLARWLNS